MIIKLVALCIVMLIIPYIMGISIKVFLRDKTTGIIHSYIIGIIAVWLLFGAVVIPLEFISARLTTVTVIYSCVVMIIIIISCIINKKEFYNIFLKQIQIFGHIRRYDLLGIVVLFAIAIQILIAIAIQTPESYTNNISISLSMNVYNSNSTAPLINSYTGQSIEMLSPDRILMILPLWIATISRLVMITPNITSFIFMPIMIISIAYMAFYLLGKMLFNKKIFNYLFLLFMSLTIFFSSYHSWDGQSYQAPSTLLLMRSWEGDAVFSSILIVLIWYFSIKIIHAKKKSTVLRNRIYLVSIMIISCYMSIASTILSALLVTCILLYEIIIYKKKLFATYMMALIPSLIVLVGILTWKICVGSNINISNWWSEYLIGLRDMYAGNFKYNLFLMLVAVAMLYVYISNKKGIFKRISLYIPLLIVVLVLINPIVFIIFKVYAAEMNYSILWIISFNIIIAYAATDVVISMEKTPYKLVVGGIILVGILCYGCRYGSDFQWQRATNIYKMPEQIFELTDIINGFGASGQKKVIAPDEICSSLRLYDSNITLFYYTHNKYSCDENKEVYQSLNQKIPYLRPIANAARTYGYGYIITPIGVVERYQELVDNKMYYIGATQDYEVYVVGY